MTDEYQIGLDRRGWIDSQADDRIGTQGQRLGACVLDQGEARAAFIDLPGDQVHWLKIAVGTSRLETGACELSGNVFGRPPVARAAGVAAFEFIIGQDRDVRPPAL